MLLMATIVAVFGFVLLLADRLARHTQDLDGIRLKQTVLIGCSQALAFFPGVSRSGATIAAGLALGFKREDAARFSFLLSAPIIAGAGIKSLFTVVSDTQAEAFSGADLVLFVAGFLAAAISGYLCIRFLLNYLQKHRIDLFAAYRFGLAAVIMVVALARG